MSSDLLIWFAVTAVFIALSFSFHSAKLIKSNIISHFIIPLLFMYIVLAWFPEQISIVWLQRLGGFIIFLTAAVILYNFLLESASKFKSIFSKDSFSKFAPPYVSELCRAMVVLTTRKLGGLAVIERKDDLDPLLGGGVAFDAQVKSEIVVALFEKSSTVHDGAMIIRDGRISRVKAVLPNSLDTTIPLYMGTRHRSAIGITERSDAIALVASEERGEFGVAYRGRFVKPASHKELLKTVDQALRRRRLIKTAADN